MPENDQPPQGDSTEIDESNEPFVGEPSEEEPFQGQPGSTPNPEE